MKSLTKLQIVMRVALNSDDEIHKNS